MANIYLNHSGSATSPYDTEAKATSSFADAVAVAANGDTLWIQADSPWLISSTVNLGAGKTNLKFKGYKTTPGDLDYGGSFYKIIANYPVFIGTAGDIFTIAADLQTIKFTGLLCTSSGICTISGTRLVRIWILNCFLSPTSRTNIFNPSGFLMFDCQITTKNSTGGIGIIWNQEPGPGAYGIIDSCYLTIGPTYCEEPWTLDAEGVDTGNIYLRQSNCIINAANGGCCEAIKIYGVSAGHGFAEVYNNTIYGGDDIKVQEGCRLSGKGRIFNNIFYGVDDALQIYEALDIFNNCYCQYTNVPDIYEGDFIADPKFSDPDNGGFSLLSISPCLNTARQFAAGGYKSIGAMQPYFTRNPKSAAL